MVPLFAGAFLNERFIQIFKKERTMAVKNFGGGRRNEAENYRLYKVGSEMIFGAPCEASTPGAIMMTRQKDSPKGNFKAGDNYYIKGGNAVSGKLAYISVDKGYLGVGANLTVGFAPEADGQPFEFVTVPLVNEKHRINDAVRRLLPALAKAELGEPVTIASHVFEHKAGDEIKSKDGDVIGRRERDGYVNYLSAYQDHLKDSVKNKNGKIEVLDSELFVQERLVQKGRNLVALAPGERAAEGQTIVYDEGVAEEYARKIVADIRSRMPKREKVADLAKSVAADNAATEPSSHADLSDDDLMFGEEDDVRARQRMS